jgi:hypothetical protein
MPHINGSIQDIFSLVTFSKVFLEKNYISRPFSIANLRRIPRVGIVKTIYEKHLILMNKASPLFYAYVARYLSFCLMQKCDLSGCLDDDARIMSTLEDSCEGFKSAGCNWGNGVAKFMLGKFYLSFLDIKDESKKTENDNLNNSYKFSYESDSD